MYLWNTIMTVTLTQLLFSFNSDEANTTFNYHKVSLVHRETRCDINGRILNKT